MQRFGDLQEFCPFLQVDAVECGSIDGDDAGGIGELAVGGGELVPIEFVQDDILGGANVSRFTKECHAKSPRKHFAFEGLRLEQPEINLEGGAFVQGIELVGRLVSGVDGFIVQMEIAFKFFHEARDGGGWQLNDEIQIVGAAGDAPVVADHGTGQHVVEFRAIQALEAVDEQLALGHGQAASWRRWWRSSSTSVAVAWGCWRRMPSRAMSQANSCRSRAMARRCSPVMAR